MIKRPQVYPNKKIAHCNPNIIAKYTIKDMVSDSIFSDTAVKNFANNNKVCVSSDNINDINNVTYLVINNVVPQMIPANITHVLIYFYDKAIILPDTVISLTISDYYNKEITLSKRLKYLKIGYLFNQKISLPETLITFIMNGCYDQDLVLPNNLRKLILCGFYNKQLSLPESIEYVHVGMLYKQELIFPNNHKLKKFIRDK